MIAVWAVLVPACTYKNYYLAERNWSFEEPFLLECLTEDPTKDGARINRTVTWLKQKYPNVFFVPQTLPIRVDVQERKHRDRAPITRFMTSTHGVHGTIARFEKKLPTRADWDRIFASPAKKAMIKALRRNQVVLLILNGEDADKNKALFQCARKGRKMVDDMLNKECAIVSARIDDPAEKFLIDNVFLRQKRRAGILILFGKGKGLHFLDDPKQHKIILDVVQMLDQTSNVESVNLEVRILLDCPFKGP
jgi:hypothetical protein